MTDKPKPPAKPGMEEVSAKFVGEAEAAAGAPPSSASVSDDELTALVIDYYAAYIARDAATDAREEVEHQAEKLDSSAIRIEDVPHASGGPSRLFLPFLFDSAGTLTPSREQVSQYCQHSPSEADELTEAVMRHLEEYGERCVAALEAAGWPEKHAKHERLEQRMDALFDQMVQTPAQGLRGIAAKVKGLVYPHEWEFLRDDGLKDFDEQINTEMFVSLVADVERLSKGAAIPPSVTEPEDVVVLLRQRWENVRAEREQLKHRDDDDPKHPDVIEDERLGKVELDIEELIANAPAHTAAGVAIKLRQLQTDDEEFDGMAPWRQAAFKTVLEALGQGIMPIGAAGMGEDPVLALKREWEARWQQYERAPADDDKITDPLHDALNETAYKIFQTPATTVAGIAFKLVLWARQHITRSTQESADWSRPSVESYPRDLDHLPVVSALHDLERMSSRAVPAIEDPILALKREWEARYQALDEQRDTGDDSDKARQPFYDRLQETEDQILRTQATTPAGIAVKLILWARLHCTADEVSGLSWNHKSIQGRPFDLDREPVLSALLDLERMAQGVVAGGSEA